MEMMRAIVVDAPGKVRVAEDVPKPVCGDYEALVRVEYCGFCNGSDFHIINATMLKEEGLQDFPTVLGHEGCGEVVEVGKKVRYIKPGDRFIHNNLRPDVGNGYTKTYGGMAEYGLVADHKAMLEDGYEQKDLPFYKKFQQVPRDFDFVDGAMLLSLSESLSAARNFGVGPGKDVIIFGAGPMGTAVATYSKILGAESVYIVDCQQDRLENAVRVAGVDRAINFAKEDVTEALGGKLFDIGIDAVGKSSVLLQISGMLKPLGVAGSMGVLKKDDLLLDLSKLKNSTKLQMLNFPLGEYDVMEENIRFIQQGAINPKDFYSHIEPMDEIEKIMELVSSKKALKVIIKIRKDSENA